MNGSSLHIWYILILDILFSYIHGNSCGHLAQHLSKQLSSASVYALRCISGFASEDVLRLAYLELFRVQPAVWFHILGFLSTESRVEKKRSGG